VDPHSGAGRKMARQMTQSTSTYARKDEQGKRIARPIPPKAKRLAVIFTVVILAIAGLPVLLELLNVDVRIGPWLSLLITLPATLVAMIFMGLLRDGMVANIISGLIVVLALTVGYGWIIDPYEGQTMDEATRALLTRAGALGVIGVLLVHFWFSLRTRLRDLHYMIADGQSFQDIMLRMQQARVIQKSGGKPALDEKGKVVDANQLMPRPGFRQKPKKKDPTEKKKRKKPKVR
jgi:hypothetical protein